MTPEEVADLARPLLDQVDVQGGRVTFADGFVVGEDEETHDAAWSHGCWLQERLGEVGLEADWSNDNDTVFGVITEKRG